MPPKKNNEIEVDLSLRFKFGIHTIFLLVPPLSPFDEITAELLAAVRERYPRGLSSSIAARDDTPLPDAAAEQVTVSYGVLVSKHRPDAGWRDLGVEGSETPVSKGIKDGTDIAFVIRGEGEDGPPRFVVEWPSLDDEDGDEEI